MYDRVRGYFINGPVLRSYAVRRLRELAIQFRDILVHDAYYWYWYAQVLLTEYVLKQRLYGGRERTSTADLLELYGALGKVERVDLVDVALGSVQEGFDPSILLAEE